MRLIDADKLEERIKEFGSNYEKMFGVIGGCTINSIQYIISQVPTIEAEPVIHGRWEYNDEDDPICSVCGNSDELSRNDYYCRGGKIRDSDSAYCPWCGAKMI